MSEGGREGVLDGDRVICIYVVVLLTRTFLPPSLPPSLDHSQD